MDGDVSIGFPDHAEFARVSSWKQGVYIYVRMPGNTFPCSSKFEKFWL